MTISMTIEGMSQLHSTLRMHQFKTALRWRAASEEAANFLLEESRKVVPYDTGYLHSTGYVEMTGFGMESRAEVGYRAYYALFVHENVLNNYKGGKMAKYLSWTAMVNEDNINAIIRRRMEPL